MWIRRKKSNRSVSRQVGSRKLIKRRYMMATLTGRGLNASTISVTHSDETFGCSIILCRKLAKGSWRGRRCSTTDRSYQAIQSLNVGNKSWRLGILVLLSWSTTCWRCCCCSLDAIFIVQWNPRCWFFCCLTFNVRSPRWWRRRIVHFALLNLWTSCWCAG